jgi:hypothetical protein
LRVFSWLRDAKDKADRRGHKVLRVPRAPPVRLVKLAHREPKVPQALPGQRVLWVPPVPLDQLAPQDLQALLGRLEKPALPVSPVLQVRKE